MAIIGFVTEFTAQDVTSPGFSSLLSNKGTEFRMRMTQNLWWNFRKIKTLSSRPSLLISFENYSRKSLL